MKVVEKLTDMWYDKLYVKCLDYWWWAYLLEKPSSYSRGFCSDNRFVDWFMRILCRAKGHPSGVIWYSDKLEPDMHCRNCGDDLG
jgi:hypothetical protein